MADDDLTLTINRTVNASCLEVWQAWTTEEAVSKWWGGPDGSTMSIDEMDVRPGGVFKFTLTMANGYEFPNVITYQEVTEPTKLVYMYDPGKDSGLEPIKSSFSFAEVDGKTEITMLISYATAAEKEKHVNQYGAVDGASKTLDNLETYLASK